MKKILRKLLVVTGVLTIIGIIGSVVLYFQYEKDLYVPSDSHVTDIMLRGGTLFDGIKTMPIPNPGILIRDGKISCISEHCEPRIDAIEIDATGNAIVPGLIDLHIHFMATTAENVDLSVPRLIWNTARFRPDVRRKLLEAGITTVRDVGGPQDAMLDLKRMLANAELAGPRMNVVGPIFTAPRSHPTRDGKDPNNSGIGGKMTFQSNDPASVRREVNRLAKRGVDGIKAVLHSTAADSEQPLPTLSRSTLNEIIQTAKENNLWTAVHVGPQGDTGIAAELGATTVEHGVRMGNLIDDETLRSLLENDVVYVPTLGREPLGHLNIPALFENGVAIGVGTDTNNAEMSFGESYHLELEHLVEAGLPPADVLIAATRNGARGIGSLDDLGTIEVGKYADLLIIQGEPWIEIKDLRKIKAVILDGRIVVENFENAD